MRSTLLLIFFFSLSAAANPYWDPNAVPKDTALAAYDGPALTARAVKNAPGLPMLRVGIKIDLSNERYSLATKLVESSGTQALINRATKPSTLGSYRARLKDASSKKVIAYDSIGTGKEYRKLVDAISFRFPMPKSDVVLELDAENPVTGKMETVLREPISMSSVAPVQPQEVEVFELNPSPGPNAVRINVYAEGYLADRKQVFLERAKSVAESLITSDFPEVRSMHFFAVFAPSAEKLGDAKNLGFPIPEKNTFLGMYYPYWSDFGRWYHVIYPTREEKLRRALASAPYDYPVILADESTYWGVGNFRAFTAIPGDSANFTYLLLHEIGHFFGLNEEYDSYGRTELEFAPGIFEPWSQNITFLRTPTKLKWKSFVLKSTELPTPVSDWDAGGAPIYGAYKGGYAESAPLGHSHKPGLLCVMERAPNFCDICKKAISDVIEFDR